MLLQTLERYIFRKLHFLIDAIGAILTNPLQEVRERPSGPIAVGSPTSLFCCPPAGADDKYSLLVAIVPLAPHLGIKPHYVSEQHVWL